MLTATEIQTAADTTHARDIMHPFERAGLGVAPFRFAGLVESVIKVGDDVKPAGTCQFCFTGIRYCAQIVSADGKRFVIGCDCLLTQLGKASNTAHKLSLADRTLVAKVKAAQNKITRDARHANEAKHIDAAKALLATDDVRAKLAAIPHPLKWQADKGATRLDWATWMMAHAGNTGRMQVARFLKTL